MSAEDIKDDELEVEVSEEETEVKADSDAGVGGSYIEETSSAEAGEESDGKKPSKFQKRIDDLVHKQREAERQRDEYYKVAQKVMEENNKLRTEAQEFSATSVTEMDCLLYTSDAADE